MENRTNILFVNHIPDCCRKFMKGLSGKYSMHWSQNIQQAVYQARMNKYDLIITDVHLSPDELAEGLFFIRQTREVDKNIPIICINEKYYKDVALIAGTDRFVFKREFFNNIEEIIHEILE
jgi:DNA-binding NtrC family response regulator